MDEMNFINDDITFCLAEDCERFNCIRHPINIRDKTVLHSYMRREDVPDCPMKEQEERE